MKRSQIKRRPLSDTVLANLEAEPGEYREHDGGGLYFRVKPNGKKSWTLRYKKPSGKWGWVGIGSYPAVSGSAARRKAGELREESQTGVDISEAGKNRRQALLDAEQSTFGQLAEEWMSARLSTGS